jgi:hypothetical protein
MCNMKCGICEYCQLKYKITHGRVSSAKMQYCNYYGLWVHEVVLNIKRGIELNGKN